ncbi:MAG: 2-octaprenyl-6-methoxyphenyl hydroxylase [Acidiferrobacterales bacterium]
MIKKLTNPEFDIVIVGGGLVGASLACALGDGGLDIAVIEAIPPGDPGQPSYDDRTIALAYSSRRIFEGIGVWDSIAQRSACPVEHIHISDRGHFGFARLHAKDMQLEALGYVAETRALGAALYEVMSGFKNITLICPAVVTDVIIDEGTATLTLENDKKNKTIMTRLVVAADGDDSPLRRAVGIKASKRVYDQTAVVANVTPGHDHGNVAYERFTSTGPLALLPMPDNRCSVVWSTPRNNVDTILGWDDETWIAELQKRFGDRLGKFSRAGRRVAYPLALTRVRQSVVERVALIGNAAHTVHPVAGQGFNLGLRDVATLAQVIVDAQRAGKDFGSLDVLSSYADWRQRDNKQVASFTDGLIRIFSNENLPLTIARNLGLTFVNLFPGIRRSFIRRTSGLNGRLPRLARGLPL